MLENDMKADLVFSQALEKGWATTKIKHLDPSGFTQQLLNLAARLGTPKGTRSTRTLVDALRPTSNAEAHLASLSRTSGTGQQPWHMDGAHWLTPPRFLVLAMMSCEETCAPTELLDAGLLVPSSLHAATHTEPLLVRSGSKSFYATVASRGQPFLRFDPGCMQAITDEGKRLLNKLVALSPPATYKHHWEPGSVLVINNWKMLHRRADASHSLDRVLYRVSVMEDRGDE